MADDRIVPLSAAWVAVGDALVYVVATILGFASHEELVPAAGGRFLATLVPFLVSWFLISPWILGREGPDERGPSRLWRPMLAAVYAAPFGAWLRGLWIGAPVQLVFVAVMAAVTAILMAGWRAGVLSLLHRTG